MALFFLAVLLLIEPTSSVPSRLARQVFGGNARQSIVNVRHPELANPASLGQLPNGLGGVPGGLGGPPGLGGLPRGAGPAGDGLFKGMNVLPAGQSGQGAISEAEASQAASRNAGLPPPVGPEQNRGLGPAQNGGAGPAQNRGGGPAQNRGAGPAQNRGAGPEQNRGGRPAQNRGSGNQNKAGQPNAKPSKSNGGKKPSDAGGISEDSLKGFVDLTSKFAQGGATDPSAMDGFLGQLTEFISGSLGESVPNPLGDGLKLPGDGDESGDKSGEKSGKKSGGKSKEKSDKKSRDKSSKKKSGEKSGKGKKGKGNGK